MDQKLRFDKFMEQALYHPQHGYYSSSIGKKIGRDGDFFTSVSVGDTFGVLLCHAIEQKWQNLCPENDLPLVIVEQGAHDAQLARDILEGFRSRNSPLYEKIEYRIIEPRETIRREITEIADCTGYSPKLYPVQSMADARAEAGIFLCNELLDAFPVRRFVHEKGRWLEQWVAFEDKFIFTNEEIPSDDEDFQRFLNLLGETTEFEDGYETEFCPNVKNWITDCSQLFEKAGSWLIIDYGFEAEDYFAKSRKTGTLQCYHQHRTHDDPLFRPGECDITAHVNFTDLTREAERAGLEAVTLTDQSKFLIEAGRDWLLSFEGQAPGPAEAAKLRQFQTLTHPSMMGRSFRVAEFRKG
ncbi:MAG: SAM-dependent methyltransferase [Verrucomicrobiales bacterium]|nr:SAM-dependent methyltransferase [Verrucomicrobiales bacterium]